MKLAVLIAAIYMAGCLGCQEKSIPPTELHATLEDDVQIHVGHDKEGHLYWAEECSSGSRRWKTRRDGSCHIADAPAKTP